MKNILLLLILIAGMINFSQAQTCNPDLTLPDSIIVFPLPYQDTIPGTGIMDTACVNAYFETVIQFQVPEEIPTPLGTFPIDSIDLATEGAVLNAPTGFDYVCNPPNCVFKKDSTGCIVIFGTAEPGSEGEYDLMVDIVIRSPLFPMLPLTLPNPAIVPGNYFLTVKPEGSENCTVVSSTRDYLGQFITLSNVPNPFGDYTEIRVSSLISGDFSFEVYNLLGQQVHRRSVQLFEGPNFIPFESENLSNGMYHYVLSNREGAVSGKMLLSRGN